MPYFNLSLFSHLFSLWALTLNSCLVNHSLNIHIAFIILTPYCSPLPIPGCEAGLLTSHTDIHNKSTPGPSSHSMLTQYRQTSPTTSPEIYRLPFCVYALSSWCGWPKQQTFVSHSFGGWKVQGQGPGWFTSWWGPSSWLTDSHLLTVSSCGRDKELWTLFLFLLGLLISSCGLRPHHLIKT